jgi:hypothetical protein
MRRDGFPRGSVLRTALAVVAGLDLLSLFFFLGEARAIALANGVILTPFSDLLSGPVARSFVIVAGIAGAVGFGRKPGGLGPGLLALGALILLSTAHAQLFGSPWRHLYYSGVCLSGWLLGLAVSRSQGAPADESYARVGSIALLGAAYLNAGISKFAYGGFDWISGVPIQAVIVGQDGLVADGIASVYRSWVVATPAAAALFSAATVCCELAGPLMLVGRRTRLCVAGGLFAMHANIFVLTHILYWQAMVFLVLFGVSSDPPSSGTMPEAAAVIDSGGRSFAASVALLVLCAFLAIVHQGRRFAQSQGIDAVPVEASDASVAVVTATPLAAPTSPLREVGPFTVGQTLAQVWSVDALTLSERGFVAALSGTAGHAAFEVTCAPTPSHGPFDLGAAHILYSSAIEFRELEAVGGAVRDTVRAAAGGRDVCDAVLSWRTSAQAAHGRAHPDLQP